MWAMNLNIEPTVGSSLIETKFSLTESMVTIIGYEFKSGMMNYFQLFQCRYSYMPLEYILKRK